MKTITQDDATGVVQITTDPPPPTITDEEVIKRIIQDAATAGHTVSFKTASYINQLFARAAETIRASDDRVYILTGMDMDVAHAVTHDIVPPNVTVAEPGSAHEGLNLRHLRGPTEHSFRHTYAENVGVRGKHCAMAIATTGP